MSVEKLKCLAESVKCYRHQCKYIVERLSCVGGNGILIRKIKMLLTKFQTVSHIINNWMRGDDVREISDIILQLDKLCKSGQIIDDEVIKRRAASEADEVEVRSIILQDLKDHDCLKSLETRIVCTEIEETFKSLRRKSVAYNRKLNSVEAIVISDDEIPTGSGAFGVVVKSRLRDVDVAIKKRRRDKLSHKLFLKEAKALCAHSLPGVIRCFGVDILHKPTMIVMEAAYCSLHDLIYNANKRHIYKSWDNDKKLELLCECSSTFAFLHSVGVIHRDIKPENILIMRDGIKVSDFGLAVTPITERVNRRRFLSEMTECDSESSWMSNGTQVKGTYKYAAPELLMSETFEYSEATDMYAFAITMNELFTEQPPFDGICNIVAYMYQSKGKARPELYGEYFWLIDNNWSVSPEDRESFRAVSFVLYDVLKSKTTTVLEGETVQVNNILLASVMHTGYYSGEMKGGKRHGKGLFTSLQGDRYEGEWANDAWSGQGKATFTEGDEYKGLFENNMFVNGEVKYAIGNTYNGELEFNRCHGHGSMHFVNGDVYHGQWVNDLFEGVGTFYSFDGWSYEGEWKKGERHGSGTFKYVNGDVYEGGWDCDIRGGDGKLTTADGMIYEGIWMDDKFVGNPMEL